MRTPRIRGSAIKPPDENVLDETANLASLSLMDIHPYETYQNHPAYYSHNKSTSAISKLNTSIMNSNISDKKQKELLQDISK